MRLVTGERILIESEGKRLVLTTQRIRFRAEETGSTHIVSILLSELACCELRYSSYPFLLAGTVVSILGATFGFVNQSGELLFGGIGGAVVFTLAYFLTRRQTLTLSSSGGSIIALASGMALDDVLAFIEGAEAAKLCLGSAPPQGATAG